MTAPMIAITHGVDGTVAEGTQRDDQATIDVLKTNGFRWSRNLGAWYLPRTWTEVLRAQRVSAVQRALGDSVTVEAGIGAYAPRDADQRAAEHVERARERAERNEQRAQRKSTEAEALDDRRNAIAGMIPVGQPILAGHYSQRRHERDLTRIHSLADKAHEAARKADAAERRAAANRAEADGYDSPVRVGRRLERDRAELRRLNRILADATADTSKDSSDWQQRVALMRDELALRVARDERVLAESGVAYSRETVAVGDVVRIRGHLHRVVKANPKTVAVMTSVGRLAYPYTEITEHRKAG